MNLDYRRYLTDLDRLDALAADSTAPETVRATLDAHLAPLHLAHRVYAEAAADHALAARSLQASTSTVVEQLVEQLVARKPSPNALGIAETVDYLTTRQKVTETAQRAAYGAVSQLTARARTSIRDHRGEVLAWIAAHRVADPWATVAPHVAYAFDQLGRITVPTPIEAATSADTVTVPVATPLALTMPPVGTAAAEVAWWAWSALAAGHVIVRADDRGHRATVNPLMAWVERPPLPTPPPSRSTPDRRSSMLGVSRAR